MHHKFVLLFLVFLISLFHFASRVLGTPIIGGSIDYDHSFKYHVSLHKINLKTKAYELCCGGTIIQKKYILTAASCFADTVYRALTELINFAEERPKVIAGTNKLDGTGIEKDIVTIFIPKTYQLWPNLVANIAVAQLRDNLDEASYGSTWEIMRLGEVPPVEQIEQATVCGYGFYKFKWGRVQKVHSKINRCLRVTVLVESICTPSFICAVTSDTSDTRTTCDKDGGSGLIVNDHVVGVLSHAPEKCNTNTIPNVFVRVSSYMEKINRAMDEDANHLDMHVLSSTPHQSPIHQAGPSSRHNEASPDRKQKKSFPLPSFFGNKSSKRSS